MSIARKLVVVDVKGPIAELGNIAGPIVTPEYMPMEKIAAMVGRRRKVYEVNPANINEKVLLNYSNLTLVNFAPVAKNTKANVAPQPVQEKTTETKPENTSNNKKGKYIPGQNKKEEKTEDKKTEAEALTESDFEKK